MDALEIECPTCHALPGRKCKRPSGHYVWGGQPHASRVNLSKEQHMTTAAVKPIMGKITFSPGHLTEEGRKQFSGFAPGEIVYIDNTPMRGRIVEIIYGKKSSRPVSYKLMPVGEHQNWPKPIKRRPEQLSRDYDADIWPGKWELNPHITMKPEHYDQLKKAIFKFLTNFPEVDAQKGLESMRYRWDIYWRAGKPHDPIFSNSCEYHYLNDNHIDTGIKAVLREWLQYKKLEPNPFNWQFWRGKQEKPLKIGYLIRAYNIKAPTLHEGSYIYPAVKIVNLANDKIIAVDGNGSLYITTKEKVIAAWDPYMRGKYGVKRINNPADNTRTIGSLYPQILRSNPAILKVDARKRLNKELQYLSSKYWDAIPMQSIINIFRNEGIVLLQEDRTPWNGFLIGRDSNASFELAPASSGGQYYVPYTNTMFILSWYRLESGRYEINAYVG